MARAFRFTIATIAAGVIACWPTVQSLAGYWENYQRHTYTHGYAIAAICLWLVWRSRRSVEVAGSRPFWPALVVTAALSLVCYLAWISGIEIIYQVVFPLILVSAVASVVGTRAAAAVSFGIGYLYFAIPVWDFLNDWLQSLTTLGASILTLITGLPAYIEGNNVHIPSGTIHVAGGCSGLHYLIVALAVAALYGEIDRYPLRSRFLLMAIAAVMAIAMNWIRVFGIIVDGHFSDMSGRLVVGDHQFYGWLLFGVLVVAVIWVAGRLAPAAQAPAEPPPSMGEQPGRMPAAFAMALVVLAVGPALTAVAERRIDAIGGVSVTLPRGSAGWMGPMSAARVWSPFYPAADVEASGEYERDSTKVAAYVNGYAYQAQGHELVGVENNLLGPSGWRASSHRTVVAHARDGDVPYREITATTPDDQSWVIGYFYVVGGRFVTSSIASKILYAFAALRGNPLSGVVAAGSDCMTDCADASRRVGLFMSANARELAQGIRERQR